MFIVMVQKGSYVDLCTDGYGPSIPVYYKSRKKAQAQLDKLAKIHKLHTYTLIEIRRGQ